ncbi:MAG: V-type ATP synthase subunit I [Deltaproteobacteria bacterium]|nr:V-type ATP synthase subunit I [Deltaproteobacteria bacterium]
MQRIRLLVYAPLKETVVRKLHDLGAVQITDFREKLSRDDWGGLLEAHPVSADVRRVTTQLMGLNRLLDVFSMVAPEEDESFFKTLFAPAPPKKIAVEDLVGEQLFSAVSSATKAVESDVTEPLARLEKAEARKAELTLQREAFERIGGIDVALESLGEGEYVTAVMGFAPKKDYTQLRADIEQAADGYFHFAETALSDTESCLLVVALRSAGDDVAACLRKWDFERVNPGEFSGVPSAAIADIDKQLADISAQQQECRATILKAADTWRDKLQGLRELLFIERERAEVYMHFAKTESAAAIEGWVNAKKAAMVQQELERCCDNKVVIEISEPDEPVEKLPVELDNPGILKHFELLVKLYAPPKYNEIDPTVLIAPTFLFFFGLMITDAMYGLLTLMLGVFILRGGGKYYPLYRSAGLLLSLGGLSTMVLGALLGGWFGNFGADPNFLGIEALNSLMVMNPMIDVANFLLFAIGVGVVHLNIGIVMGIVKEVRRGDTSAALKHVWIFFLEIALVCYYFEASTAALIFCAPALLMLLYAEKGMALFGVTGLLGDTLSYARLMALGLVSFGLAVAINALAKMTWEISMIGWLISILIFVAGHLFSLVLNLMGGFAHGIRLHFVEFFGKFYEGGGEDFEPFRVKRELTEVK